MLSFITYLTLNFQSHITQFVIKALEKVREVFDVDRIYQTVIQHLLLTTYLFDVRNTH